MDEDIGTFPKNIGGLKTGREDGTVTVNMPIGGEKPEDRVDTDVIMSTETAFQLAVYILALLADVDVLDKELLHTELHDLGIIK